MFRSFHVQGLAQSRIPHLPQLRHRCVYGGLAIDLEAEFFWNCTPDSIRPETPFYRCSLDDFGLLLVASNQYPAGTLAKQNSLGK